MVKQRAENYGRDRTHPAKMTGLRKYICVDCGATRFLHYEVKIRKTCKTHCLDCGSTFLEPFSEQAKADERNAMRLVADRKPLKTGPPTLPVDD